MEEKEISEELLQKYIKVIYEGSGIYFANSNSSILKRKIIIQAKANNTTPEELYNTIVRDSEKMAEFIDNITTNFTKFFRHEEQFDLIKNKLIPEIALKREHQGIFKIKLWSAGCATGEEAYSLLISALESLEHHDIKMSIEVIASDISLKCLEIAQRGIYSKEKLEGVPQHIIKKYFNETPDGKFRLKEEFKKFIRFDYHNLLFDNGLRNIDIVMCRNVLIYMDEESIKKVLDNIFNAMNNDGYLFLGTTESLFGITKKFKAVKELNTFYYIKVKE
ncbi:MAG: CheR family methyltransferase [Brevinematia bacterium]